MPAATQAGTFEVKALLGEQEPSGLAVAAGTYFLEARVATAIGDLYAALKSEVDRVVHEQETLDHSDELSEELLIAIRETLKQIKLGADSEEFTELAIINFIIRAAALGYTPLEIKYFVKELRPVTNGETITII